MYIILTETILRMLHHIVTVTGFKTISLNCFATPAISHSLMNSKYYLMNNFSSFIFPKPDIVTPSPP
jgi:hypothetical protein